MRKLLTGAALALLAGILVAPSALAHSQSGTHDYRWADDAPTPKADGTLERLSQKDFVTIKVNIDDGLTWWKMEMRHEASGATSFCEKPLTQSETKATKNKDIFLRCNWDTTRIGDMTGLTDAKDNMLGSGPVAPNGVYVVSGWFKNGDGYCGLICTTTPNEMHALTPFKLEVANPVSAVTGIARSYNSANRTVTVTWNANPEPDIAKYIVQEKAGDGAWNTAGERPGNVYGFEKPLSDPGSYQYRVIVQRPMAADATSAPTPVLEVTATPTTTGDSPPGDGPAPGEPGVTIPTDPPSPTTASTSAPAKAGKGGSKSPAETSRGLFSPGSIFAPRSSTQTTSPRNTTTTEADPGYSEQLPYTIAVGPREESALPEEPKVIKRVVQVPTPRDPRAMLVPLAGGLAIFVFAMQMTYVARRRPAYNQVEDDFGDWVGM